MIADMKFILDNYYSQYEIRHYKGVVDNKTILEQFYFEALIPCINDILSKRFYSNIKDYQTGLISMLQHIIKMENLVGGRSHKKAIKNTITKFKIHTREIYQKVFVSS